MAELTPEVKELIRKYLLTLVVLPASVMSVLSFALGWFVNEGARGAAYAKAYGEAQSAIVKLASSAAASAANAASSEEKAKSATSELARSLETVREITANAEEYGEKLTTVIKAEEGLAQEVAVALLRSPASLTEKVTENYGERLEKNENIIEQLRPDAAAARTICYGLFTGTSNKSLILVPLPSSNSDLDEVCHSEINGNWHAGGIAKARHYSQDCETVPDNHLYGGGYTSFVTEQYFESNRATFRRCNASNAFICCSTVFPN